MPSGNILFERFHIRKGVYIQVQRINGGSAPAPTDYKPASLGDI